jgi:hypothetical protein
MCKFIRINKNYREIKSPRNCLEAENAKHNSRENKLVYIIKISGIDVYFFYLIVICIPIKSHQSNQTCSAT